MEHEKPITIDTVIQYTYQAHSTSEANTVAEGLQRLDGCLDAQCYGWSSRHTLRRYP